MTEKEEEKILLGEVELVREFLGTLFAGEGLLRPAVVKQGVPCQRGLLVELLAARSALVALLWRVFFLG